MPDLTKIQLATPTPVYDQLVADFHATWAPVERRQAPLWYEARELVGEGAEFVAALAADLLAFARRHAWDQVLQFALLAAAYLAVLAGLVFGAR